MLAMVDIALAEALSSTPSSSFAFLTPLLKQKANEIGSDWKPPKQLVSRARDDLGLPEDQKQCSAHAQSRDNNPRVMKRQKIMEFFSKEMHNEKDDHMVWMWNELHINQDKQDWEVVIEEEKKAQKVQEANKLQKQKQCAADKAKELVDGKKRVSQF